MFDSGVSYTEIFNECQKCFINEEFSRREGICYLDHTGCPLYSNSLIEASFQDLRKNLYGNPHSGGLSSKLCIDTADQIRYKILQHFNTSPKEYSVIFTSGATASLKLVAESFKWTNEEIGSSPQDSKEDETSVFMYLEDNHTSVLGMRQLVSARGAEVMCLKHEKALDALCLEEYRECLSSLEYQRNSLFVYSAMCNFSGLKYPLSWIKKVHSGALCKITKKKSNWFCLLDAATYVSTNKLDLSTFQPDFVAISFYKMFGFPTGLGALLVHNRSSNLLQKIYYGGGTVFMALSEENTFVPRNVLHERFEDGTINFLSIVTLAYGFELWSKIPIENISQHCFDLAKYTFTCLSRLHHSNGAPVAIIYSDTVYDDIDAQGGILNFNLLRSNGEFIGFSEVLNLANLHGIHLRTGCFCNPGACRRHLELTNEDVKKHFMSGHVCGDDNDLIDGQPTGSVRISFGPYTTLDEVNRFLNFILNCFVQKPHIQMYHRGCDIKSKKLKNIFTSCNEESSFNSEKLRPISMMYSWFENLGVIDNSSICDMEKSADCSTQKRFSKDVHLCHIFIYPVKSCGQYSVKRWELSPSGLKYDRTWMITTNTGVALTQKMNPRLCLIKPVINLEKKKLILTFKGAPSISVDIDKANLPGSEKVWFCSSKVCDDSITGLDCGDEVSSWLSIVLKTDGLRLVKLHERNSKVPGSLSLSNQAQYLLINRASVDWLSAQLPEKSDCQKESMLYRFRGNFVISGIGTPFEEQNWKHLRIGSQAFKVTGPCRRCQMICIDQETSNKTKEPLTTLAASFKGKLKFGVYLSTFEDEYAVLSIGDQVLFET